MNIKKFGVLINIFLLVILGFISGCFTQANASSSSTTLPLTKGGTGANSASQALTNLGKVNSLDTSNTDNQFPSAKSVYTKYAEIGREYNFSIIKNTNSYFSWGVTYENLYIGYEQPNGMIIGSLSLDAEFTISSRGGVDVPLITLPTGYQVVQGVQQLATLFKLDEGKTYHIWTEGTNWQTDILKYWDNAKENVPLGKYRLLFQSPLIIKKV
ncbi:MAG: hypothetical protein LBT99_02910 [Bifidobacteriaceae bacterium]|jgi:hypothetical protein|nr:hypothetical protein [Bifidobacteriaceae bacterium]